MPQTVCIAPGHGGFDSGAIGIGGLEEKNVNLAVSLALEKRLAEAGIHVVMTRTTDEAAGGAKSVNDDLANQCKIANDANVDLFFTIHCNAATIESASGAEAWIYPANPNAAQLAQKCVKALDGLVGTHGEPVKDGSRLWVIHDTQMTAVLVELGFVTNEKDATLLNDHADEFAAALAGVLIPYLGGTKPATTPSQPEPPQPPAQPPSEPTQPQPVNTDDDSQYVTHAELEQAISNLKSELQAPAPAPIRTELANIDFQILQDGFFFILPVSIPGQPDVKGVEFMQLDTGAFEILIAEPIVSGYGLPNNGPVTVTGIGGNVDCYASVLPVKFGDTVIEMPCVVDPHWDLTSSSVGLFGMKGLIDNGLSLDVNTTAKKFTIYKA